ncbi:putative receptor-like protein kinase [Carex littledalei]|uniref:Putative receptor-like protein kinase n=1 Tax=Carex littledalei TaxID=544730 RepID=A0A833VAQ2_9POAL|nr:putative receptor-like protein kinase [Carex littledalei]
MKFVLAITIFFTSWLPIALGETNKASSTFTPRDNFLINCGSTVAPNTTDGRVFKTDSQSNSLLSAKDAIRVSVPSSTDVPSPLYLSARIFRDQATYKFPLSAPGWHWIRLHFFPLNNTEFDLTSASFTVTTDSYVLLHSFSINNSSAVVLKEFLVNATTSQISLHFLPLRDSAAFINAIEVVSAPDILISDIASTLAPVGQINGLSLSAYQTVYRLNVGGPLITSANDTLGRSWDKDDSFIQSKSAGAKTAVAPSTINYPEGTSPLIAPNWVYATAVKMADAQVGSPNFNITWQLDVESSFGYLIRLHFADIISKSLNDLYFNVYINGKMAISGLDLSTITSDLSSAYYKDFVLNSSSVTDQITVQIGPLNEDTGTPGALLNGLEVLKMNNSVGSLDGEFGVDGKKASTGIKGRVVAAAGIGFACVAFVGVGAMMYNLQKKKPEWERRSSFSSWLLPIHAGHSTFMNNSKGSGFGSHKSGYTFSSTSLGRCFSFAEIQTATKNFDQNAIIGVGGFGNVFLEIIYTARTCQYPSHGSKDWRPPINPALPREQVSLAEWALQSKRKGLLEKIIDPLLVGTINKDSLNKFVESTEKCLSEIGTNRPSMGDVLWNLEYALQLQEANPPTVEEETQTNTPAPATQQTACEATLAKIGDDAKATEAEAKAADKSDPLIDFNSTTSPPDSSSSGIGNDLFVNPSGLNGR